jgi:hypothetical protein
MNPKDAAKYASIGLLGTGLGYAVFGVLLPMGENVVRTSGGYGGAFTYTPERAGGLPSLKSVHPAAKYGGAALGLATGIYLAAPKKKVRK